MDTIKADPSSGMEDESKGWEIQEYYSSSGDEDGNNKLMLRRIVRRGLRIGKTIFVTGVVISSAPFILPPLMVVSAVGLACSVPFGVFVASYACAEKLMSKLLPMPKPPPPLPLMLEYKGNEVGSDFDSMSEFDDVYENEVEYDDELEEDVLPLSREAEPELDAKCAVKMSEEVETEGGADMDEERLLEDTKADIEMRISLPVGKETETVAEDKYYEGMANDEEQKVEEGYQEDDESSAQQDEQSKAISGTEMSGSEIHPMVEILRQERPIENVNIDDSNIARKTYEDIACRVVEVEGPYGLTIGAIEQITPEKEAGDASQAEQSMTVNLEGSSKHNEPTSKTRQDSGSQFTAKHRAIKIDNVHSTGVEGRTEMFGVIETAVCTPSEETMKTSEQELAAKKDSRRKQGIDTDPLNVEFVGETPSVQKDNLDEQHAAADATTTAKRKKKGKKKKSKSEGTTAEGAVLKIDSAEQEGAIPSTANARNIMDESGLNLVSDKEAGRETQPSEIVVDVVQPKEFGTTSKTPSGRSFKTAPKKELISEEKIWENIEALRTIVGYRVARHQSCMEELKALYIFTGVEPPMSFKSSLDGTDAPDLDDVNDKLRFLMAIVGVK